jgi:hypothetical protein
MVRDDGDEDAVLVASWLLVAKGWFMNHVNIPQRIPRNM